MSATRKLSRHEASEFLEGLRRDISAARLRVTVDGKLGLDTPQSVKKLAALPDPPVINDTEDEPREEGTDDSLHMAWASLITSPTARKAPVQPLLERYGQVKKVEVFLHEAEEPLWPGAAKASSEQGTNQR